VSILPPTEGVATPPDSTCTDPHVDGCPRCVLNVEEPIYLVRVEGGCDAAYVCTDCKHSWETAWGCR
jgi:hypothetical protein